MLPIRRRGMRLGPVLFLLLAAQAGASAPAAAPMALSAAQAREDVQLAADAAEAALTDPFWHQSREEWAAARRAPWPRRRRRAIRCACTRSSPR